MSGGLTFQPKWRMLALPIADAIVLYFSVVIVLGVTCCTKLTGNDWLLGALLFTPLIAFWLAVMWMSDLHDLRTVRDLQSVIHNLLVTSFIVWVVGSGYLKFMEPWALFASKAQLPLAILISFPIFIASRRVWLNLCDFHLEDQKVVFLGDRDHVRMLQEGLEHLSPDTGFSPVDWHWPHVDLVVADGQWVDEHWDEARDIFLAAVSRKVPIISFESFYESLLGKVSPEYASRPSWTLEFALHENKSLYPAFKRFVDATIALVLLALSAPVLLTVAAAIYLFDGAPVFYGQRRVGYKCREFTIWKFRTMKVSADAAGPFTSAKIGESQITPVGRWLRRFRMDELPQLWNVLKGEMSLVGPRPEWTEEIRLIENHVPNYHLRHLVQPGITGWAQVYFRATNNFQESVEKLHYDLYYLKYFSFSLDLSILLKTVKRLFISDARVRIGPSLAARSSHINHRWASDFNLIARSSNRERRHNGTMASLLQFVFARAVSTPTRILRQRSTRINRRRPGDLNVILRSTKTEGPREGSAATLGQLVIAAIISTSAWFSRQL